MFRLRTMVGAAIVLGCGVVPAAIAIASPAKATPARRIFGVTVDDVTHLPAVIDSLRALPRRPWVRIVFDVNRTHPADPAAYPRAVTQVAKAGPVLGELVDSSALRDLSVAQVAARTTAYVRALGSSVSVWEVGNEVNGDWTDAAPAVARKVQASYDIVHGLKRAAELTLYENEGCGDGPGELSPVAWSRRYLPAHLRAGLAYVLLSYYEDQCHGRRPSAVTWAQRFAALHRVFPKARLGFGELGMSHPATSARRAEAAPLIAYYYRLRVRLPYYVGGGFYWYFAEDMVPWRSAPLWGALAQAWSTARPAPAASPNAAHPSAADPSAATVTPPPPHAAFSYQIGGAFPPAPGVGIVDRDRHAPPAAGVYDICYVNAFQAQPGELGWWRAYHPSLLLRRGGRPVIDPGWNEQLLDTSTPAKRRALAAIIGGWIARCARAGYRGVEPDNLDSWTRSRGALSAADNFALARLLIERAHADGLAIAQKNAAELAARGRRIGFDFAIAEECQAYDECASYLNAYGNRVIEIEYPDDGGVPNFERACRLRGARISIVYRDRAVTSAGQPGFIERRCP